MAQSHGTFTRHSHMAQSHGTVTWDSEMDGYIDIHLATKQACHCGVAHRQKYPKHLTYHNLELKRHLGVWLQRQEEQRTQRAEANHHACYHSAQWRVDHLLTTQNFATTASGKQQQMSHIHNINRGSAAELAMTWYLKSAHAGELQVAKCKNAQGSCLSNKNSEMTADDKPL